MGRKRKQTGSADAGGAAEPQARRLRLPGLSRKPKPRIEPSFAATTEAAPAAAKPQSAAGRMASGLWARLPERWRGVVRRAGMVLGGLAVLPLVLTLLYAVPFVRPVSTLMLWDLVTLQGYDRQWRGLDEISPNLKNSVIMSEDGQFCSHHGVDLRELRGVVEDALDGESTRGASTITMQVAKNLFLWPGRSFLRKVLELPLAIYLDLVLSKRRIMEIYLNIAEWGPENTYGIGAAAERHFGIDAKSMSRRQAALLTVTLPNPILRNPAKPARGMSAIARVVERRAGASGGYTGCVQARG